MTGSVARHATNRSDRRPPAEGGLHVPEPQGQDFIYAAEARAFGLSTPDPWTPEFQAWMDLPPQSTTPGQPAWPPPPIDVNAELVKLPETARAIVLDLVAHGFGRVSRRTLRAYRPWLDQVGVILQSLPSVLATAQAASVPRP